MMSRKAVPQITFLIIAVACSSKNNLDLNQIKWIHGSADCSQNKDEAIQVVRYNATTWILRQNKCINYEAPFMYLFLGTDKALLMDTGATSDSTTFPLRKTVDKIIADYEEKNKTKLKLIVAHSHSHSDHHAADDQFRNRTNTEVVQLRPQQMKKYFGFQSWPQQNSSIDLGKRVLTLLPIPGHDEVSIAVYDSRTHILLTGDSFYPGRLYVRDWSSFKQSLNRLVEFSKTHQIDWVLGNHVEMRDTATLDYPTGTTYQPHEAPLPLTVAELEQLVTDLKMIDKPIRCVYDKFIVEPVPAIPVVNIEKEAKHTITLQGYPDFLASDGDDVWVTNVDMVQKLSASSTKPVLQVAVPGNCGAPVVVFESLWVASCKSNSVVRINSTTGKVIASIACGISDPSGELSLAASEDAIWISSDTRGILSKIDPLTNKVVARIPVKPNSFCITYGFGSIWITNTNDSTVQRIDAKSNLITATISVGGTPRFLAAGEGAVWTLNQTQGTVSMIDPSTNEVIETIKAQVQGTGGDIDAGNGRVWIRAKNNRMLQSIDPLTGKVTRIYEPLNGSGAVRVAGKYVWVTAHDVNKVWVLDSGY
jgi:DNA-binding beta-propeller fold protein YncE/glyoxylase-like metal-dependent hydrolase (beta-lactamase superfamily II)